MENSKRLFIALPLSAEAQDKISLWQESKRWPRQWRWLPPLHLHLTAVPPWQGEKTAELIETLKNVSALPFDVCFSSIEYGPNPYDPRLVWALGETPKELADLIEKLYEALKLPPSRRAFKNHLTVARFQPWQFFDFENKKLEEDIDWRFKIDRFELWESELDRQGVRYTVLAKFPLGDYDNVTRELKKDLTF